MYSKFVLTRALISIVKNGHSLDSVRVLIG